MESTVKVLLIEDNKADARLIHEELSGGMDIFFNVVTEDTLTNGLSQIENGNFDVILTDLNLPDSKGLNTFKKIHEKAKGTPVVILSSNKDEDLALNAVREGAQDYLVKSEVNDLILKRTIQYAMERQKIREDFHKRRETLKIVIENTSDLVLILDLNGNYLYKSPSFIRLIGEDPESSHKNYFDDIENKETLKNIFNNLPKNGAVNKAEYNILQRNGKIITIKSSYKVIHNLKDEPMEIVIVSQVI